MSGQYTTGQTLATRTLGQILRDLRAARGEKLRVVAAAADMDPSLLSKIELGQRFPTPEQSAALARHYGVALAQLDAARMAEEILEKLAANPEAAAMAMARVEEGAGEYRVNTRPMVANKPAAAVNKPGKRS
jgi:transcriptional regulator with XRE-family HTH domain